MWGYGTYFHPSQPYFAHSLGKSWASPLSPPWSGGGNPQGQEEGVGGEERRGE